MQTLRSTLATKLHVGIRLSSTHLEHSLAPEQALLHVPGLGDRDLVDHEADTAFADNITHAITDLDVDHRGASRDAHHREAVNDRVGAPADAGPDLCVANHAPC